MNIKPLRQPVIGAPSRRTRRVLHGLAIACLTLSLASCASPIRTGYETAEIPGTLLRYAWGGAEGCERIPRMQADPRISPFTMERIRVSIEASLRSKGYQSVTCADDADFVVTFSVWLDEKVRIDSYPDRWIGVYHRRDMFYSVEARQYTTGTLAVDMFDASSAKPLWHGWASKTVTASDRDAPEATIRKGVDQLLAPFPSRTG
jgi:hypothetical protein